MCIRDRDFENTACLMRAEVQALVKAQSPGISRILDMGFHQGDAFLVLELVEGQPTDRVIRSLREKKAGGLSSGSVHAAIGFGRKAYHEDLIGDGDYYGAVVRIICSLLLTVEAIHSSNVRHRDIKPANVLLCAGGRPVLLDFGLATQLGFTREELSGTLVYMAPEQIKKQRSGEDHRADLYQVGLLMFEFLTLRPAFELSLIHI